MSNDTIVRHILVIEDQKSRRIVSLEENTYDLGRDPNSAIPIYDRQVSRHHATLIRVNDYQNHHYTYRLIDGNLQGKRSTNGVVVNGQYCLSHELEHGDVIRFGNKSKASYHVMNLTTESELDPLKVGAMPEMPVPSVQSVGETYVDPLNFENLLANDDFDGPDSFDHEAVEVEEDSAFSTAIVYNEELPDVGKSPTQQTGRLVTLSEYSSQLIIELTTSGQILYANPIAKSLFPELMAVQSQHALVQGLINLPLTQDGMQLEREIAIGERVFNQQVFLTPDRSRLRCYCDDITNYRKTQNQYADLQRRLDVYRRYTLDSFLIVAADSKRILEANAAYCRLLGYSPAEITNLTVYQVISGEREAIDRALGKLTDQDHIAWSESQHRRQDGTGIRVSADVYRQEWGGQTVYCFVMQDLQAHQSIEEALATQAFYDPITKLPNRLHLEKELSLALNFAEHHQHSLGVMLVHLESLNQVNQSYDYRVGDRTLLAYHSAIAECVRTGDVIAQWDGATLGIILAKIKNPEDAVKLVDRIFEKLKTPIVIEKHEIILNSNIGIAVYPHDGKQETALLTHANVALQRIRREGFNQYQFYNPRFSVAALYQARLEILLQQAIDKRQLSLHYQPQLHLQSGNITGVEALLRWEHPEVGDIPPSKLIPIATNSNLIFELSDWIIKTACQQNLAWQKDGLPPMAIAVNLSTPEFYRQDLVAVVGKILTETGLDPQWLELEITEATLRHHPKQAQQILNDLHKFGVKVALDDFGRGYAGIGFITQFPIETLKIDQNLIRQLRGSSQEMAIISAILTLAKGFQYRILAEGVETETQLSLLQQLHCQEVQGFWLSRPLRAREMSQFLQQQLRQS
ncbi:MAG: EAL domain-containing protein [Synechocystis sp.]|nr:EAL domain-containing protein [Synechocystis sp.]